MNLHDQRRADLSMLAHAISHLEEAGVEPDTESSHPPSRQLGAFFEIREKLLTESTKRCAFGSPKYRSYVMTDKERSWVRTVLDKFEPEYEDDLVSSGKVPRGREVQTIPMLRRENLPMKPPGRR